MVGNDDRPLKVQRPCTVHHRALKTRGLRRSLPWCLHLSNLVGEKTCRVSCDIAS